MRLRACPARFLILAAILSPLVLAACQKEGAFRGVNPTEAVPVDTSRIHATEVGAFRYRREVSADLNGDGKKERLVIAADVSMGPTGPLWEDAHRWAVYVEPEKGGRTLLYGALVPNGFAEAAVMGESSDKEHNVLVQERTPQQVRAFEIEYEGAGKARLRSAAYYPIGEWLPGSAAMR